MKGKTSLLIFLFLFLTSAMAIAFVTSCSSPTSPDKSPEPEPTYTPYTYGLYDDFESGSIDSRLWYDPGFYGAAEVTIKDDEAGNKICEIRNTHIDMRWPRFIYPDEFNRLRAKVRLPSQNARDFYACLRYSIRMNEQGGLNWWAEIGICKDSAGNKYFFAEWRNHNTSEVFHKNLGDAELDKWYRLEMKIIQLNSTELKIEYSVNNIVLAETIPTDSTILLDHNKISNPHRYLLAYPYESSQPSTSGKGWFDDVWGVYGDKPSYFQRTQSISESPSLIDGLLKPIRHKRINREKEFQEERRRQRKSK